MRLSRLLRNSELFRAACIFAALMCLLSLLPLPMLSFQTASRYAVLLAAGWAAVAAIAGGRMWIGALCSVAAIALNPIVALLPSAEIMRAASLLAAALLLYASLKVDPAHIGSGLSAGGDEADPRHGP